MGFTETLNPKPSMLPEHEASGESIGCIQYGGASATGIGFWSKISNIKKGRLVQILPTLTVRLRFRKGRGQVGSELSVSMDRQVHG